MKYIKTNENNIYKRLFVDKCLNKGTSIVINGEIMPYKEEVVKEADKIEELCDEFVCWMDNFGNPINAPLSESERYEKIKNVILLGMKNKFNCWLKLGIWTDKGLIYVAKMKGILPNGEVDWELL